MKRHFQVRLVKDNLDEVIPETKFEIPLTEIRVIVDRIFIGIGFLIVINALSKGLVHKFS